MKKQGSLSKKKQVKKVAQPIKKDLNSKEQPVFPDLSDAYVLKGNVLHLPNKEQPPAFERKFQSEDELRQLIFKNPEVIFGEHTLSITAIGAMGIKFSNGFMADAFLFHFVEMQLPRFYLLKVLFSQTRLIQIFYETTPVFGFLNDLESAKQLIEKIAEQIGKDKVLTQKIKTLVGGESILPQLVAAIRHKPSILFISDNDLEELPNLKESYPQTWGAMIRQIIVKRYAVENATMITFEPSFDEISIPEKMKRDKESRKAGPKLTEAEHLEKASDVVREIYGKIKAELLKIDKGLEFRSTNYYVSVLRYGWKVAVFHIRKNSISVVMLYPIAETQKLIKHSKILLHKDSVQKFWGGECCTVVIQTAEHLGEVIGLFQKMLTKA